VYRKCLIQRRGSLPGQGGRGSIIQVASFSGKGTTVKKGVITGTVYVKCRVPGTYLGRCKSICLMVGNQVYFLVLSYTLLLDPDPDPGEQIQCGPMRKRNTG
jgi:hypothetical protein